MKIYNSITSSTIRTDDTTSITAITNPFIKYTVPNARFSIEQHKKYDQLNSEYEEEVYRNRVHSFKSLSCEVRDTIINLISVLKFAENLKHIYAFKSPELIELEAQNYLGRHNPKHALDSFGHIRETLSPLIKEITTYFSLDTLKRIHAETILEESIKECK